ncbi:hypothetical protein NDA07_26470 [Microcoleus vaginatus DQ-U2]|uniref:hypothetical protein n=1 Tax=Microcoleus vaginatus TaxID=119532 RepID=UPI0016823BB3|nr:hypothetical protein [Microcoleus sp. FACHB-DQ6]
MRTYPQKPGLYQNIGFSNDKSGQQPGLGEIVRSQTNHKTFNATRDDKLPEIADSPEPLESASSSSDGASVRLPQQE